jgi:hypothetical protein
MKRFLFFLPVVFLFLFAFNAGKTYAAPDPVPPPGRIPCEADQQEDPNFNSSRPYQASPCGDSPKAVMCGNTLQVIEKTPTRTAAAGTEFLDVDITVDPKDYIADLTGAQFPIVGNTELTKNSQSAVDKIDDATKVNEYLSNYLSGTTDEAEYGSTNLGKIIDFSGPVKKLIPGIIQDAQRMATIKYLTTSETYTPDETVPVGQTAATQTDEAIIHNQIIVCTRKALPLVPGWITNFLGVGSVGLLNDVPVECYPSPGGKAQGTVYRLNQWQGESRLIDIVNAAGSLLERFLPPTIINQALADAANHWPKNYPPLPWADKDGVPFKSHQEYRKAYNEWRGNLCTFVANPFGGDPVLLCAGLWPILSNPYADLYKYVPLSNTVDKQAKNMITGVGIKGLAGTEIVLPAIAYEVIHEPILYFPHTAESIELSNLLNTTYKPKEGTTNAPPPETTEPINDPTTGLCRILDVRTNSGDYLFPEVTPNRSEVNVHVNSYQITRIPCNDVTRTITDPITGLRTEVTQARCQGEISIEVRMVTKVPNATEIYNSTTAGADSTFRKMFPKVGPGAPITCVSNLPSQTGVQYIPRENFDGMKVIDPLNRNTTDSPSLYFPHFGSVYDLFLKGIQTAIRPKGFGEPIVDGKFCSSILEGTGDCKQWLFEKDPGGQYYYDKIIAAAASTTCNGRSLNPAWALGIALNENGGLMTDKLDGSSNSHFGCFVSEVGTIEDKLSCMLNTLQRDCVEGKTDAQALAEYGYVAGYVLWPVTILSPGAYPPPLFGSGFNTSQIKAALLTTNWFDAYKATAPIFCPASPVLTPPTP